MLVGAPGAPAGTGGDLDPGFSHRDVHRLRLADFDQAEQPGIEPAREAARRLVVDRPCGADEVRHPALEKRLGKAGRERCRYAVRNDPA